MTASQSSCLSWKKAENNKSEKWLGPDNKRLIVVRMLQGQMRGGSQEDYSHLMTTNVIILLLKKTQQNEDSSEIEND